MIDRIILEYEGKEPWRNGNMLYRLTIVHENGLEEVRPGLTFSRVLHDLAAYPTGAKSDLLRDHMRPIMASCTAAPPLLA